MRGRKRGSISCCYGTKANISSYCHSNSGICFCSSCSSSSGGGELNVFRDVTAEMLAKFTEVEKLDGQIYACDRCNSTYSLTVVA